MTSPESYLRSREVLSRGRSRLLIVDVQEKLVPLVKDHERMVHNCSRLIDAAALFAVDTTATEQYPRGLGHTVQALADRLSVRLEKVEFSAAPVLGWHPGADAEAPDTIVVAGIEAHVCILQTCFDLLTAGFAVHVPADAVSSRSTLDCDTALRRLRDAGVVVTTTESVLFEWCETAGTPEFKQISRMIRDGR